MTISDAVELQMQRRQTLSYIGVAPVSVSLRRRESFKNQRGGVDVNERVLAPQQVRILFSYVGRRANQNRPTNPSMGGIPYAKDLLLARWDADVEAGDTFSFEGVEYKISYIYLNRDYETCCNLQNTGEANP